MVVAQVHQHRGDRILSDRYVGEDPPSIPHFTSSSGVEDMGEAIGEDRSSSPLTERLVVDTLDTAPTGDVVLGCGELERAVVGQGHGGLYEPLAVALYPEDDGPIHIL